MDSLQCHRLSQVDEWRTTIECSQNVVVSWDWQDAITICRWLPTKRCTCFAQSWSAQSLSTVPKITCVHLLVITCNHTRSTFLPHLQGLLPDGLCSTVLTLDHITKHVSRNFSKNTPYRTLWRFAWGPRRANETLASLSPHCWIR